MAETIINLTNSLNEVLNNFEDRIVSQQTSQQSNETLIGELRSKINQIEETCQTIIEEHKTLKSQQYETSQNYDELKKQFESTKVEIETYKRNFDEFRGYNQLVLSLSTQMVSLNGFRDAMERRIKENESNQNNLSKKVESFQRDLANVTSNIFSSSTPEPIPKMDRIICHSRSYDRNTDFYNSQDDERMSEIDYQRMSREVSELRDLTRTSFINSND